MILCLLFVFLSKIFWLCRFHTYCILSYGTLGWERDKERFIVSSITKYENVVLYMSEACAKEKV